MEVVGRVESLWRYPVKSMRGERLDEAFVGFAGVYGDRIYAFSNAAAQKGFPYLTARECEAMLLYQPRFRHPEHAKAPPNLAAAESLGPGLTPVYPAPAELIVDVETPSGTVHAVDDPLLIAAMKDGAIGDTIALMRSDRALTDCRPVSLISLQTVRQIGEEAGAVLDMRRFRANIYADLAAVRGFAENAFVGRTMRVGARAVIAVTGLDPRCKMITLDPDTAQAAPEVLRTVARGHGGMAGVYGAVMVEGTVRPGDAIVLLDPTAGAGH
jgi:MOSC domain-containing protein